MPVFDACASMARFFVLRSSKSLSFELNIDVRGFPANAGDSV